MTTTLRERDVTRAVARTASEFQPVTLDIETVPTEAALAMPYPEADRDPPNTMSKPDTIKAWRVADEAKWHAERAGVCSLSPRLGRVLCIGMSLPCSDGQQLVTLTAPTEADEPGILRQFWEAVALHHGRVVTFNGRTFDLRWIVLRSLALRIAPSIPGTTVGSWFARYRYDGTHTDVRDWLTNWDERATGTLADWCAFAGVAYENSHSGADVYDLYRAGKFSEIAAKCRIDVAATQALYEKCRTVFAAEAA